MKVRITPKAYAILSLILFLLVGTFYAFLFVTVRAKQQSVSMLRGSIEAGSAHDAALTAAKDLVGKTAADRAKLDSFILQTAGVVPFITSVERLGTITGTNIEVRSVGITAVSGATSTEALSLSVSTEGSWNQMMHFLSLIESLPYRVELTGLQFVESTENPKAKVKQWEAQVSFSVAKMK